MKYTILNDVLNFSWREVASAFWHRYPNPKSEHVLSVDTFHREIQGEKLITKRLIKKKNSISLPGWGQKFCPKFVFIVEESIIDPKSKSITTYTRNIGSSISFCSCHEKCVFTRSLENKYEMSLQREVFIKSFMRYIGGAIEKVGLSGFQFKAAPNATKGFNYILTKMYHPEALIEEPHKLSDRLKESKEKVYETTEKQLERMEKFLAEKKELSKEKLLVSKEKMLARKERVQESAQRVAEKSKESKERVKEKANRAAELYKETLKESKVKVKERAKKISSDNVD